LSGRFQDAAFPQQNSDAIALTDHALNHGLLIGYERDVISRCVNYLLTAAPGAIHWRKAGNMEFHIAGDGIGEGLKVTLDDGRVGSMQDLLPAFVRGGADGLEKPVGIFGVHGNQVSTF